jgi:hypothetical protein
MNPKSKTAPAAADTAKSAAPTEQQAAAQPRKNIHTGAVTGGCYVIDENGDRVKVQ